MSKKPEVVSTNRAIDALQLMHPLPSGGVWFTRERGIYTITRDGDVGFYISDTRGKQWWTPMANVVYVVYEDVAAQAAAE